MATRNNAEGPGRTSNAGRKEASGGNENTPAANTVGDSGGRKASASTSRGGGSDRSAASKGGGKQRKGSSVPSQKGK